MTTKNIALAPDLFERIVEEAAAEGKTTDEIANELLGSLLDLRKRAEASDRRWQNLVDYGNKQAERLGIQEEDVDRLIHAWRSEQRGG